MNTNRQAQKHEVADKGEKKHLMAWRLCIAATLDSLEKLFHESGEQKQ